MQFPTAATLCLLLAGAASAGPADVRRETIRFPFNMPKGHMPTGGFNFMAQCYNFIDAVAREKADANALKCHAEGKLCGAWANALPDVIAAKRNGRARSDEGLTYSHWCQAVRNSETPDELPVFKAHRAATNFKAQHHADHHVEYQHSQRAQHATKAQHQAQHKVVYNRKQEQTLGQKLKAVFHKADKKIEEEENAHHLKLKAQAEKLREEAAAAKEKAAKAKKDAEEKASVAAMMKELSAKAAREVAQMQKAAEAAKAQAQPHHKDSLLSHTAEVDTSEAEYERLVNSLEKKPADAPKADEASKLHHINNHHGWANVLATEEKIDASAPAAAVHKGVRGGDFVQESAVQKAPESRVGHLMEELYEDVSSLIHRVV
jgi:chemotaxis protein histidine kinase CheA